MPSHLTFLLCLALLLSSCSGDWMNQDPLAFLGNIGKDKPQEKPQPAFTSSNTGIGSESLGLKLETYLAYDIQNPQERIKRLEQAVITLGQEIQKLSEARPLTNTQHTSATPNNYYNGDALQNDTNVTAQPQTLFKNTAPTAPPLDPIQKVVEKYSNARAVSKGAQNTQAKNDKTIVSGIRVGEHPDKIRIVFDVNKKTAYTVDLDNNEKFLIVELPSAAWKTPTNYESFGKMPLLQSYRVEPFNNGQGNLFILQLKGSSEILAKGRYPALSGNGERIVIDLKK